MPSAILEIPKIAEVWLFECFPMVAEWLPNSEDCRESKLFPIGNFGRRLPRADPKIAESFPIGNFEMVESCFRKKFFSKCLIKLLLPLAAASACVFKF